MFALGRIVKHRASKPGDYDPDGRLSADTKFDNGLSRDETAFVFAYWALFPAPLFFSCDLTAMDDFTLALATNDELLEINQDYPARPATFEDRADGVRVARRRLSGGREALGFFNPSDAEAAFDWPFGRRRRLRDPLARRDLGAADMLSVRVPAHGVRLVVCDP